MTVPEASSASTTSIDTSAAGATGTALTTATTPPPTPTLLPHRDSSIHSAHTSRKNRLWDLPLPLWDHIISYLGPLDSPTLYGIYYLRPELGALRGKQLGKKGPSPVVGIEALIRGSVWIVEDLDLTGNGLGDAGK